MKRTLVLVVVVVAVAVGVAVASVTVSSNAATVNGTAISRQSLNTELAAIAGSPQYQCYLHVQTLLQSGQTPLPVAGAGMGSSTLASGVSNSSPSTYSSTFTGYWLDQMINAELLTQFNARRGVTVTSYDLQHGRVGLERYMDHWLTAASQSGTTCAGSASAILATLPQSFVNDLVARQANEYAFVLSAEGTPLTPASVARYYSNHHKSFDQVCVIALPVQSQADAQQVQTAVAGGTPFASIAQGAGGGTVCGPPALSQYLQTAAKLSPGQLSPPLTYGQNYLLLQLTSVKPSSLTASTDDVIEAMYDNAATSGSSKVAAAQRESHVAVDPRYGHWVAAPAFTVVPPTSPPSSSLLCPAANDPAATTAVCPPPLRAGAS